MANEKISSFDDLTAAGITLNDILGVAAYYNDGGSLKNVKFTGADIIAATGGDLDFSGFSGSTAKVNLNSVTTQPQYGYGEIFTALGSISCGQPVVYDYTGGVLKVTTAGSLPDQSAIVGIALADANDGDSVTVLIEGFITARRTTTFNPSSETYVLPNSTPPVANIRPLTNDTTFTDDGGGSNYSSGTNYYITFDVGSGSEHLVMTPNSFGFEDFNSSIYDRLGIQVSNDNVAWANYTTAGTPWLQAMSVTAEPWGSSFAGASWNSAASSPGWVFPTTEAKAATLNGSSVIGTGFPITSDGTSGGTRYRYVRFYFYSDSGSTSDGWNLSLTPSTPFTTPATSVPEGQLLYLDPTDLTKITTTSTGGIIVGMCAYDNPADDSLLIRLIHEH